MIGPFLEPSLAFRSEYDRLPLHIACLENLEENLIRRIFTKEAAAHTDKKGMRPLHYACDHKNAQINVVEMLVQNEYSGDKYPSNPAPSLSPLLVAVKADAPDSLLEILLQPEFFTLVSTTKLHISLDQAVKD